MTRQSQAQPELSDSSFDASRSSSPTPYSNQNYRHISSEPESQPTQITLPEDDDIKEEMSESGVIPSPATENDPPLFSMEVTVSAAPALQEDKYQADDDVTEISTAEFDGDLRLLKPKAEFKRFTLWTPDAPVPGFKQDELVQQEDCDEEVDEEGAKLRKGWWSTGGAGEGGDDFVRGLGEWLGLVEVVSRSSGRFNAS